MVAIVIHAASHMDEHFLPKPPQESSTSGRQFSSTYIDLLTNNDSIIKTSNSSSFANVLSSLNRKRRKLSHRSHSAPLFSEVKETHSTDSLDPRPPPKSTPLILQQAFNGVVLYVLVVIFLISGSFKGTTTVKPVDALYFTVVTLCTIGFGDIVPDSTFTKLFTCAFILVGFVFIDILLNGLVTYICDRQEAGLLSTVDENRFNTMVEAYVIDRAKGRMRIRTKVCLALGVVIGCIAIGTISIHILEELNWVDSLFLSVTSVTTVGYGDYAFTTVTGRCFAIIWLLISTLAVAKHFSTLLNSELKREIGGLRNLVLEKKMTLGDLVAVELDNGGSISKYEFVIFKPKEMGKITEKDILQINNKFDSLDYIYCCKITLADLMDPGRVNQKLLLLLLRCSHDFFNSIILVLRRKCYKAHLFSLSHILIDSIMYACFI